jgi:hypothetical protein
MVNPMLRFVVVRGVLAWGLTSALIFTVIQFFQGREIGALDAARNAGIFMIGGIFWGITMWWFINRKRGNSRDD